MNTTVLTIALTGIFATGAEDLDWLKDYSQAKKDAIEAKKPMAVFLGTGKEGWKNVSRSGDLTGEMRSLLRENYVCVYVDCSTAAGKKLMREFDFTEAPGLIISNRTGTKQAYRHEGQGGQEALTKALRKYADPKVIVEETEYGLLRRVSNYQPPVSAPAMAPRMGGC